MNHVFGHTREGIMQVHTELRSEILIQAYKLQQRKDMFNGMTLSAIEEESHKYVHHVLHTVVLSSSQYLCPIKFSILLSHKVLHIVVLSSIHIIVLSSTP
jgi:hypothetical protein